jgi:peptide chain release factor 1
LPSLKEPVGSVSIRQKLEGFAASEGFSFDNFTATENGCAACPPFLGGERACERLEHRGLCQAVTRVCRAQPGSQSIKAYRNAEKEIADLAALVDDSATDTDMRKLADAERHALQERKEKLAQQIRVALLPKDAMDDHNAILEIRAGTGGDEAALFAGDLFRMYERYAAKQGWKTEVLSLSGGTKGGFKEIVAEVRWPGRVRQAKFESAAHRAACA